MLAPWKKSYDQPRQHIKKQRHYLADKGPSSQSYGFSSSHVWMWQLDHKESWVLKNWCFWTSGEGEDRGWDGWMVSPTQWPWVWANSGSWWWTGKPGVLQSVGSQRVRHDWATELIIICLCDLFKNKILIINSVLEYNLFLEKKSCILKWFLLMYGFWKQVWEVEAT